ncbi:MAG: hypothetical protein ABI443_05440 [Chthoniobacterales bacterium]
MASRFLAGGNFIGLYNGGAFPGQGPINEVECRAGGVMFHTGKREDVPAQNFAFMGWQRDPNPKDIDILRKRHEQGAFIIGFGPKNLQSLAEHKKLCDAWLDTGFGKDDTVLTLSNSSRTGHVNNLMNVLNAWAVMAEFVAACTRQGQMPVMYLSIVHNENDWNKKYMAKGGGVHDDIKVPPIPPGVLAHRYIEAVRGLIIRFGDTQLPAVEKAASLIASEKIAGRDTVVAYNGHSLNESVGMAEDSWAKFIEFFNFYGYANPSSMLQYVKKTPNDALVLRIDQTGMHYNDWCVFVGKNQRLIDVTGPNNAALRPDLGPPKEGCLVSIDLGYEFGDAALSIDGYPIKVFPPSGVVQSVVYECINAEVMAKLAALK